MKISKKLGIAAWFVLCVACISTASFAQEQTPDDPKGQEARALMEEGFAAANKGDLEGARESFKKSFKIYESYDVACNLGVVEFEMKLYLDAAQHLDFCLRNFATGENRELLRTVKVKWKEIWNYVGAVEITTSGAGAQISIDGEPVGTTPMDHRVFVVAGRHTARAEGSDGVVVERAFTVEKGKTVEVELLLESDTQEGTSLPVSGLDEPTDEEPTRAKRNWVPAYILGGVTVAAFGTSMVFRGLAGVESKNADKLAAGIPEGGCVDDASPGCSELDDTLSRYETRRNVANATLITSAVLAAATVGYVIYASTRSSQSSGVAVQAMVGGDGGRFVLRGRF